MSGKARNRIAWAGAWSRDYNNVRYAEFLPRFSNVDCFYIDMHPSWIIRGFRRRIWLPLLVAWLGFRYRLLFCTDWKQIGLIRNRVVCDHDDPMFTPEEISALNKPNVVTVVVTLEEIRTQLIERGVRNPIVVIPQGITDKAIDKNRVAAIRAKWTTEPGEIVVGLHQPRFILSSELPERSSDPTYAIDALLDILTEARKKERRLVLWLVGEASAKITQMAKANPWIRLVGYQPRMELLNYVAGFDIGVYPRPPEMILRGSIKVLDYMACGVPVVGYKSGGMKPVIDGQAGIVADDAPSFVAALVSLARDGDQRMRMGDKGRKAVQQYSWEFLSVQYRNLLEHACDSKDTDE